jgi:hypothetical protein
VTPVTAGRLSLYKNELKEGGALPWQRTAEILLTVLKAELDFVQKGGYRLTARSQLAAPIYFSRLANLLELRWHPDASTLLELHNVGIDSSADARLQDLLPVYPVKWSGGDN